MTLYYLLLFATPFHYDPRLGMTLLDIDRGIVITPVKVLGLLTVVAALLAPQTKDYVPRLQNSLVLLFLLFAVIPVFTILVSGLPIPAAAISQLISAALLLIATRALVRTKQRLRLAVRTLIIAFAFSSLWVYKEFFVEHISRPGGVEGEANYEALMLLLAMPSAFWMWRHDPTKWWRRIGLGCALLLAGAEIITESRAGIVAAGVMGLLGILRSKHKLGGLAALTFAGFLTFAYGPSDLAQRFKSIKFSGEALNGDEGSTRIHIELLKAGLYMMERHPVFGVGLGQFKTRALQYNPDMLKIVNRGWVAHDIFMQIGAECGLPVLLLFLSMVGVAYRNFGVGQVSGDPPLAALGSSMQIALIGISVAATGITSEGLPFWILIFLSMNFREIVASEISLERMIRGLDSSKERQNRAASSASLKDFAIARRQSGNFQPEYRAAR
jgi:putative inorganic carbon (hco3(-)) transporter